MSVPLIIRNELQASFSEKAGNNADSKPEFARRVKYIFILLYSLHFKTPQEPKDVDFISISTTTLLFRFSDLNLNLRRRSMNGKVCISAWAGPAGCSWFPKMEMTLTTSPPKYFQGFSLHSESAVTENVRKKVKCENIYLTRLTNGLESRNIVHDWIVSSIRRMDE